MRPTRQANFFRRKVLTPVLSLLTMGITPQKLALTVALGSVLGILPVFGLATLLCTGMAIRLRLNLPAIILVCYLVSPLHLVLYVPFIKLGIFIVGADDFRFSFDELMALVQKDWLVALKKLWLANLLGLFAWVIIAVPLTLVLYYSLLPVLRKYVKPPRKVEVELVD